MRAILIFSAFFSLLLHFTAPAQSPKTTANDVVPPYTGKFGYGANMGYYKPFYYDKELATLVRGTPDGKVPGIGATTIRPGLYEFFLDEWGYVIRRDAFRYYDTLGLRDNVVMLGYPSARHRDEAFHCPNERSELFRDMYEPIWDNGENDTPVNEKNPYATYVYWAAKVYGPHVKFWEVWNEPDFSWGNAWKDPGMEGNWWENTAKPCEMAIKAPVSHYVRMLRITYEVLKTIEPTDYVCIGGLGYPSFLDMVCRSTDNPADGSVSDKYPNKGGAYFDCMSFHTYPHIDNSMRVWSNEIKGFRYSRHSDAAVDGVWRLHDQFDKVLGKYGYDGKKYPEKEWIVTEFNIPRRPFGDFIGSDMAQINFMVKALVTAQMKKIRQMHVYSLADEAPESEAKNEFAYMGLFKNLRDKKPYGADLNPIAVAYKTTAELLADKQFDPVTTEKLQLPPSVRGGAFKARNGEITYVLWATTNRDMDEATYTTYTFPESLDLDKLEVKNWHFARNGIRYTVNSRQVLLDGSPSFFNKTSVNTQFDKHPKVYPNPLQDGAGVYTCWVFEDGLVTVEVINNEGKVVQQILTNQWLVRGPYQFRLDLYGLNAGIYHLRFSQMTGFKTISVVR
jgi:hypothetical protein